MYRPNAFQVDDPAMLYRFIAEHPLSTFATTDELGTIATSQLPLLRGGRDGATTLIVDPARANPQSHCMADLMLSPEPPREARP